MADMSDKICNMEEVLKKHHYIPKFQRNFTWGHKQANDLFEDIIEYMNNSDSKSKYIFGQIIVYISDSKAYVIDGQQRLTAANLFIAALQKIVYSIVPEPVFKSDASNILTLCDQLLHDHDKRHLQVSKENSTFLNELICGSIPNVAKGKDSQKKMLECYETFVLDLFNYLTCKKIKNFDVLDYGDLSEKHEMLSPLSKILQSFLSFNVVYLVTYRLIDAHRVFDTTNSRGMRLSGTDLTKNHLFATCYTNDSDLENDDFNLENTWDSVYSSLGGPNEFNKMFRYAMISRVGHMTQDEVFDKVKNELTDPQTIKKFIDQLSIVSDVYQAVCNPKYQFFKNNETTRILKNISRGPKYQMFCPILISIVLRAISEKESYEDKVNQAVKSLDSIIGRVLLPGIKKTNALEEPFGAISSEYFKGEISFGTLLEKIREHNVENDNLVRESLCSKYNWKNSDARYIYTELYRRQNQTVVVPDNADIEHILPDNNANYSKYWPHINVDEASNYNCRLGNLALLKKAINRGVKDHGFFEKVEEYKKEQYALLDVDADEILDAPKWDFDSIIERTHSISDYVVRYWPYC